MKKCLLTPYRKPRTDQSKGAPEVQFVNCQLHGAWEGVDQMSPSPDAAHRLHDFLEHMASITRMGFFAF